MQRMTILDSTLRDGAQGESVSFSVSDKLNIARSLDDFGVDYIEAGNPGSNPKDLEFFEKAASLRLLSARLCAFGSTRRKGVSAGEDENLLALLRANTSAAVVFGKTWDLHVSEVLRAPLAENLEMIADTVRFLKSQGREVIFDAEHFYDGYVANPDYAREVLRTAARAGADILCLCDTNGGMLPLRIFEVTGKVCGEFDIPIGVHTHNDSGCAVANTLTAVEAGAAHVQGTFIGIGERCGNADLSSVIPDIALKTGRAIGGDLTKLTSTAGRIAEIANIPLSPGKPYVGGSAFAHKGGMHKDAMQKNSATYEHVDPALVGNTRRFLISEVDGGSGVLLKASQYAPGLAKSSPELARIVERIKEMEHYGYQFEAADASFELLVKKVLGTYASHFTLVMYKTIGEFPAAEGVAPSTAAIKIDVDGKTEIAAAMGKGPVNALDIALRKALTVFYPELSEMKLTDYKVRVLDASGTTAAKVRVLIESADASGAWTTIGVSDDIIEASLAALVDSIEYKLSASSRTP